MSEFDMKYTGKIIKELREKAGENQEQLAEALGVANRETVARWESGARDLRREHIIALAQHFHVSADYLLGLTNVKAIPTDGKLQAAAEVTGLSEGALLKLSKLTDNPNHAEIMSKLLERALLTQLLKLMIAYVKVAKTSEEIFLLNFDDDYIKNNVDRIKIDFEIDGTSFYLIKESLLRMALQDEITHIADMVTDRDFYGEFDEHGGGAFDGKHNNTEE